MNDFTTVPVNASKIVARHCAVIVAACWMASVALSGRMMHAQGMLASRVEAVREGTVRLSFAARAGVCGSANGWSRTRPTGTGALSVSGSVSGNWTGSRDVEHACDPGPVRLVVVRADGATRELRTKVGGRWRVDSGSTDLGMVSAVEAGRWLLSLAEHASDAPARGAIQALTITDSVDAWPVFLRIAKDEQRPKEVRSQAIFWLGEYAGDKVSGSLDSMAYDPGDREVRKQAIFAMSRRPVEEAVPSLIRMAESLPDRELRKTAIFWLSRSNDPRALAWLTKALESK